VLLFGVFSSLAVLVDDPKPNLDVTDCKLNRLCFLGVVGIGEDLSEPDSAVFEELGDAWNMTGVYDDLLLPLFRLVRRPIDDKNVGVFDRVEDVGVVWPEVRDDLDDLEELTELDDVSEEDSRIFEGRERSCLELFFV
jgi:hypothetical protein